MSWLRSSARRKISHQPIRVTALGYEAKLVDKILIRTTDTAVANAVVVVDCGTRPHPRCKPPLDDHANDHDKKGNGSQNNNGASFHGGWHMV